MVRRRFIEVIAACIIGTQHAAGYARLTSKGAATARTAT